VKLRTVTILKFALLALLIMILPSIVLASGDEASVGKQIWDLFWRIANFVILAGVLLYFTRKPIANAIKNSIESVKKLMKDAEESRRDSEARMKEAEEKLAGVDREISDLLASARKEGEAERERILAEAAEALEKLKAENSVAIALELKKAKDILKKEAANAAVALAEEILSRKITPEDQTKFVDDYLEKLEAKQ
jgi:F-type H+-transporting ATPase subunit b